jgi:CRP/FNR family transcriptional regulator, cyclic AMP receptor protein
MAFDDDSFPRQGGGVKTNGFRSKPMTSTDFIRDNGETIMHLRKIPAMEAFTDKDLEEFLLFSEVRNYQENELIIAENTKDDLVFYLVSGKARVVKNGRELIILRRTGDVFGEIGVIAGVARSASVYAAGPTTCISLRLSQIENLDEKNRLTFKYILFRGFAEILANRLKRTTEELIETQNKLRNLQKDV